MGDGTRQNPYTREDVIRLIEENGGKAGEVNLGEGIYVFNNLSDLDLSKKVFEERIDLHKLDLSKITINYADLVGAHFEGAILAGAHLENTWLQLAHLEGAFLWGTYFEGADLSDSYLKGAVLQEAHLEKANLAGAKLELATLCDVKLSSETRLEDVEWGPKYILGEEEGRLFDKAADIYRRLKQWYTNAGMYDIAGEFFFREMTARRKQMKWWPNPFPRLWSKFLSLICGYGERPLRVIAWAASVILVSTLICFLLGSVWEWSAFWTSLYFSAVSFTALGYGSWLQVTNDWIRAIGAFESFIGVFSIALFLVTFIRKMTR